MGAHFGFNVGTASVLTVVLVFLAAVLGVCSGGIGFHTDLGFGHGLHGG